MHLDDLVRNIHLTNPKRFIEIDTTEPIPKIPIELVLLANQITQGIKDSRVKAYAIHTWIVDNIKYKNNNDEINGKSAILYALQHKEGTCYSMTRVYVALAKSVGLDARIVRVYVDEYGEKITNPGHVCAGVMFNEDKFLLFDPAYEDGDAQHKEVRIFTRKETNEEIIYDILQPYYTAIENLIEEKKFDDAYMCCEIALQLTGGYATQELKLRSKKARVLNEAGLECVRRKDYKTAYNFFWRSYEILPNSGVYRNMQLVKSLGEMVESLA
ncbi:MAG: transglutaminase domain-containing protein [Nanoarchaeota archaeon]|nr:transglutaminase domain-containing protein [Nanoarchaeota archaeon]